MDPSLLLKAKSSIGRIAAISDVTGLSQPDATELIVRNAAMLDVLPLRLNSTAEALSVALAISKQQALSMLAADQNLLDIPALRIRQQLEALSALLQVPFDLLAQLAVGCPYLLRVDGPAVKIRWSNISALLGLAGQELEQLLLQEPRLLMPSSSAITHNYSAICSELDVTPALLKRWVSAAPMLLLVPAPTLKARLKGLLQDPRVLLLNPEELPGRLNVVQQELRCSMELLLLLVCGHPSYLVVEPGFVSCWTQDVRHLTNMSAKQACKLLVSPQVFLTMTPEEVLLSLQALSSTQQLTYPTALHMAVQDAAGALSLSVAQLAMLLTSDASLWYVIHPRGTWGLQQQQEQLPGLASLVAAMSAVTSCGVRPPAVMQQAILQQPGLLQLTPQAVHQQVQRLVGMCGRSESWKQQLQALPPQLVGKGIIRAAGWGKYWLFLVATGLTSSIRLHDVLEAKNCCSASSWTQSKVTVKSHDAMVVVVVVVEVKSHDIVIVVDWQLLDGTEFQRIAGK
eukprot:gene7738-7937_t